MENKRSSAGAFAFWCSFFVIILTLIAFAFTSYSLPLYNGTVNYNEPIWYFNKQGEEPEKTKLNDRHILEPDQVYELSTKLTYSGLEDKYPSAVCVAGNYQIKAYLDDELKFSYTRAESGHPNIKSVGNVPFSVPLGANCTGKTLKFEIMSPVDFAIERTAPTINIGDYSTIMYNYFISSLPQLIMCAAIFFGIIILIMLGDYNSLTWWSYIFFGTFSLLIIIYCESRNLFLMHIIKTPALTHLCEYFTLCLCPLPIVLSYRTRVKPNYTKTFNVALAIGIANVVFQLTMHFCGIIDIANMLKLTHCVLLAYIIFLLIISVVYKKTHKEGALLFKLSPIILGAVLELAVYYWNDRIFGSGSFFTTGNYISLGLLASLAFAILDARKNMQISHSERERSKLLEKMAYLDSLTGLKNRAAFDKEIFRICQSRDEKPIICVSADLNGLKKTNDTYGHQAGDELIRRAGNLLKYSLNEYGNVYRTGGDEFYAFLYDVNEKKWEKIKESLFSELKKRNDDAQMPLSIAIGHGFVENGDVYDSIRTADRKMYQNKATYNHRV